MVDELDLSSMKRKELIQLVQFYIGRIELQEEVIELLFNAKDVAKELLRKGYNELNTKIYGVLNKP